MGKKLISICIPVFNESKNIVPALKAVEALFETELKSYDLEIIVTDNASTDETWELVQKMAGERPHLKGYRFSRNFGYQNSIFAGLSVAQGDAVVELDADLEDPPSVIPEFVKKWEAGFDVAYGVRLSRESPFYLKIFFHFFYIFLNKITDFEIPKNSGDFKLLDRKVVNVLKSLPERNLYLRGLVTYLGFKQVAVPYSRNPRLSGNSKFRFFQYVVLALDAVTAFSKTPLRMIGFLGSFLCLVSTSLAIYYFMGRILYGTPIAGFTTLVCLTLFLHGISFVFLGVFGEYLSRIFDDSKFRPRVIIAEAVNTSDYPKTL